MKIKHEYIPFTILLGWLVVFLIAGLAIALGRKG